MASSFGEMLKVSVWGESHGNSIGVIIDGMPSGYAIDIQKLQEYCDRRRSNGEVYATPRKESDIIELQSGIFEGYTTGSPITFLVKNLSQISGDYKELADIPRPSHADYAAHIKYDGYNDIRGGGHFSGRLTLPLVIAGGLAAQILESKGVNVSAYISEIGGVKSVSYRDGLEAIPPSNYGMTDEIYSRVDEVRRAGDSVGGIIECIAEGLPVGLGEPIYSSMESMLSRVLFGVPAVKGVEFGLGFDYAKALGSIANDSYRIVNGKVTLNSNNNGGITGGLTNGAPMCFRVAVKPTPSISIEQDSISLKNMSNAKLKVRGRHDSCIVPRAVVVIESVANAVILDAILLNNARH